jgi:hypothetical protein
MIAWPTGRNWVKVDRFGERRKAFSRCPCRGGTRQHPLASFPAYQSGLLQNGELRPARPISSRTSSAREKLVNLADRLGVKLRQSYKRVGKFPLIMHQRYAHARPGLAFLVLGSTRVVVLWPLDWRGDEPGSVLQDRRMPLVVPKPPLVPDPVEVFGDYAELDDEVCREVLWPDLAPLFLPQPDRGLLVHSRREDALLTFDRCFGSHCCAAEPASPRTFRDDL